MKRAITFQWIDPCPNVRLREAQEKLRQTVLDLGLEPLLYPAGPSLVKFADVLRFARERSPGRSFVWCNSDVLLTCNPYDVDDGVNMHGFHRREIPSGERCGGVDMYLIPQTFWDEEIADDVPDLWCGGTHVDWWLTRAGALKGRYFAHDGFIDHPSHEESGASKSRSNPIFRHNVSEYNAWARRNGAGVYETRLHLPFIGDSMSPLTDYLRLLLKAGRKSG